MARLSIGRALVVPPVPSPTSPDPSPTPRSSRGGSTSSRSPHPMMIKDIIKWEEDAIKRGKSRDEIKKVKMEWYRKVCSRINDYLYLGGDTVARTQEQLQEVGITHILNAAGTACGNYFPTSFQYLTLDLFDGVQQDIIPYFFDAIEFIEDARQNHGKVFVHCHQGVSRSSSFVIGYLMWRDGERFETVLDRVKNIRSISSPNDGFTGRLLMWQRILMDKKNRLYYMALIPNNSERFLHIVPIECDNVSVAALDPRTCFVLRTVDNEVFLWRGSRCPERVLLAGRRFAKQLERFFKTKPLSCELYEQQMEISSPTTTTTISTTDEITADSIPSTESSSSSLSNSSNNDYNESMSRFWQLLGASAQPSEPIEEKTALYPYLSQLLPLLEQRTDTRPLPPSPDRSEVSDKPKCRLYEFPHLESLGSWEDDELDDEHSDCRFGLLCHYESFPDRQTKSAQRTGECYIWVGSQLAEKLDEEYERSQAERLIREKGELPFEMYKIFIEVQLEESDEFWRCFETYGC